MVEWFKAAVLKTAVAQVTEGSNPSFSANIEFMEEQVVEYGNRLLFFSIQREQVCAAGNR